MLKSEARKLIELADSLNESGAKLSQVMKILDERTCCFISAYREEYDIKENENRRKVLSEKLRDLGYGFINLKGVYTDSKTHNTTNERSCLVINTITSDENFLKVMLSLMNEFDQDSIAVKFSGEYFTWGYYADGRIKYVGEFHVNRVNDMMSYVKGKAFVLESNTIKENCLTGFYTKMTQQGERGRLIKKHESFLLRFDLKSQPVVN